MGYIICYVFDGILLGIFSVYVVMDVYDNVYRIIIMYELYVD